MRTAFAALALLILLGCASTPQQRLDSDRNTYQSYPPAVQQKIAAGQIDIGFTSAQVRMALGDPSRILERNAEGGASEVWEYAPGGGGFWPNFSIGFGVGGFGPRVGGGIGANIPISGGGDGSVDTRVIFTRGVVSAIERVRG